MKNFKILLGLFVIFVGGQLISCSKHSNTPVDQYVEILDEAVKKANEIKSYDELTNVQAIISPEDAMEIMNSYSDYELTDKDKEKLKKSFDKLLKVAYEKTAEYGGLPEEMKKTAMRQSELIIEAANKKIDNANTLGDIAGIK